MTEQTGQKAGENGKWEESERLNKGERKGAAVEGGKNMMERQKCGSCENVKEKCMMEFAPAGAKGEGTVVNKESGCQ